VSELDHLWAGWRSSYIESVTGGTDEPGRSRPAPEGPGSLFERILQLDESVVRYLIVINEGNLPTSPAPEEEGRDEDEDGDEVEE
jgi:small subunit ribosomal protein S6